MKRLLIITFFILFVASCSSSDETSTDAATSPTATVAETTTTVVETTTTITETTTTDTTTTTVTEPPINENEILSASYPWGPSEETTTLQTVLGFDSEEVDGWYGLDTYQAHVSELLDRDLSIENVPEPPTVAPIASGEEEWLTPDWDLVDCQLAVFDMAPLCGVEINTPSAEAIAMLVSILGPASEDTGWNEEAGCAAIGQSWRERRVSWGEIDAVFNGLNPSVFSGWRVYRNLPPLEANWPDFPISLPNGLYLGDPLEEVAAMMGYDAEELSMHSFEEYGLPGIYRFDSPEFGYQYGQSYPRINGIIDDTLLMHIASPGLPAFVFCD